jgi:hypothetical protein
MGDFTAGIVEIIKWVRESIRPVVVTLIVCALALFLPHLWRTSIGIGDWLQTYRPWMLLLFTGSLVWLGTFPIETRYRRWEHKGRLAKLAGDQQELLKPYVQNKKTVHSASPRTIAVANTLVKLGVLTDSGIIDGLGFREYAIDAWTLSYLCENPNLVGIRKISN